MPDLTTLALQAKHATPTRSGPCVIILSAAMLVSIQKADLPPQLMVQKSLDRLRPAPHHAVSKLVIAILSTCDKQEVAFISMGFLADKLTMPLLLDRLTRQLIAVKLLTSRLSMVWRSAVAPLWDWRRRASSDSVAAARSAAALCHASASLAATCRAVSSSLLNLQQEAGDDFKMCTS